ncbi:hypothetical protein [Streptomonospora wellingtoniae]|uniref:Uncharacterized protein n=1 Tax=Streptomonospora wellingtoniae TaxID=3075544 RepID=A0ABU2KVY8_9ACTN|nr:hypothetical protein [Streptomonospora sp. DSM 45055]MDT0303337.1 hypothetical protein [Streptomonospora sp. DSM 45055]
MPSSDSGGSTPPSQKRRASGYGPFAWTVFVLAIVSVLVLLGGCVSVLYGPLVTGDT